MARTSRDLILWFFLALFISSLLLMGKLFWPFFSVIVLSSITASLFYPVHRRFESKVRPALASLLTCLFIVLVFVIPTVIILTLIGGEVNDLVLSLKQTDLEVRILEFLEKNRILERLNALSERFSITTNYGDLVQPLSDLGTFLGFHIINQANAVAGYLLDFVIGLLLILISTYYLLLDGKRLITFIINLSPLPDHEDQTLLRKFKDMSTAVLVGNGVSGLIQGVIGGLVCSYFGFSSPILWGLVTGFFSFLPIFGIGVTIFPVMIYMMIKSRFIAAFCLFVIYVVVTAAIEYLVRPFIVGKRVNMHPLLVFFSIIGGIYMSGILGVIYGPLIMTFFLTLTDIYHSNYRKHVDPDDDPSYEETTF